MLLPADKRSEIRAALCIESHPFSIDDAALAGKIFDRSRDVTEPRREVFAILGVDQNLVTGLVKLEAVAVEFHFVQPAFAQRRRSQLNGFGRPYESMHH